VIKMREASLVILVLLVGLMVVGSINSAYTAYAQSTGHKNLVNLQIKSDAANATKPIVIIELKNGTLLNFSSIDSALIQIYSGNISMGDVKEINVTVFQQYIDYLDNRTESPSYIPALKVFYEKISPELRGEYKNYSGQIIPVSDGDYILNTYGENYPRIPLYGVLPYLNVTLKNANSNATEERNILEEEADIFMLIYARIELNETLDLLVNYTQKIMQTSGENLYVVIVDVSNSFNISAYTYNKTLPDTIIVWDNQTKTIMSPNGSFNTFVVNGTYDIPLIVILDRNGVIWFKTLGLFDIDQLSTYINMYIREGIRSLPVYPILAVVPKDPFAGKPCKIYILLGLGFGNITEAKLSYELLDANNKTIYRTSKPVEVSPDTLTYTIERLDNRTRWLVLNATVISEYGVSASGIFIYKVQYERKKEENPLEKLLPIIYSIIALIVILGVSIKIYRKYFKSS